MTLAVTTERDRVKRQPETLTLTRPEGTRFSVTLLRAPSPGRATVLVVPAMGMPAGYYETLISDLAASGLGAGVMEQRGHEHAGGRLPGWRYDFGYADLVDDVAAAVDLVGRTSPDSPILLLGHSLGAHICSVYAAHRADQVAGLVMVAAGSIHWRLWSVRHLILTQGVAVLARLIGHHPGTRLGFGGREARGVMADWARFARTGRLRFGRPRTDHDEALHQLALPALVVSLEGDVLAPARAVDGLVAKMPSLVLTRAHVDPGAHGLPGTDHFRWVRTPELVVPTIRSWIDGQATVSAS
jgi:predicted alpha/beta hydrolase